MNKVIMFFALVGVVVFLAPAENVNAYCDEASVRGVFTINGLSGTAEEAAALADCRAENDRTAEADRAFEEYQDVVRQSAIDDYVQRNTDLEMERQRKFLADADKDCKERRTGPNSHYEAKDGKGYCVCNIGYEIPEGGLICEQEVREPLIQPVSKPVTETVAQPEPVVVERIIEKVVEVPVVEKEEVAEKTVVEPVLEEDSPLVQQNDEEGEVLGEEERPQKRSLIGAIISWLSNLF